MLTIVTTTIFFLLTFPKYTFYLRIELSLHIVLVNSQFQENFQNISLFGKSFGVNTRNFVVTKFLSKKFKNLRRSKFFKSKNRVLKKHKARETIIIFNKKIFVIAKRFDL